MKKIIKYILGLGIFIFAIVKLSTELKTINFQDVYTIVRLQPFYKSLILLFSGLIGVSILGLYDFVLITSQKIKAPLFKAFRISWISNSLNNLIGLGGVAGATIRYNFLSSYVDEENKAELKKSISLLLLSMITGIGFLSLLILTNIFSAADILGQRLYLKIILAILAIMLPIFIIATTIKPPVASDRFLSLKYTLVSACDYIFVGIIMYLSLHFVGVQVDFWKMESIFIVATIAGLISMAPGGIGAFDLVFLLGMQNIPGMDDTLVLLALVFYRLVYYIIPFILGVLLSANELQIVLKDKIIDGKIVLLTREFGSILISISKKRIVNILRILFVIVFIIIFVIFYNDSADAFVYSITEHDGNNIFVLSIYVAFSMLLLPNIYGLFKGSKETQLKLVIQLAIIFISQLIIAAQDLYFNKIFFTILLLLSLYTLRKINLVNVVTRSWVEKVLYCLLPMLLLMQMFYFQSVLDVKFDSKINDMVIMVALIMGLWIILSIISRYIIRRKQKLVMLNKDNDVISFDKDRYNELLKNGIGSNLAHLGFLSTNNVLIDTELNVAAIYQETKNYIFVLGDPIGAQNNMYLFIQNLDDYARQLGKQLIYYQTSSDNINIYTELNYKLFNLGEEGIIDVENFSITGNKGKEFRKLLNKQNDNEYVFSIESVSDEILLELEQVSCEWLKEEVEMSFSVGSFDKDYLKQANVALIRDNKNQIIAFASMMPIYIKGKLSVDLIRWKDIDGISMMDLLYLNVILWAQENNYKTFNIGMAPLSTSFPKTNTLINAITDSIYMHSSSIYSFKGLRRYKSKFKPNWEPRYLIYPHNKGKTQMFIQCYNIIHPKKKR